MLTTKQVIFNCVDSIFLFKFFYVVLAYSIQMTIKSISELPFPIATITKACIVSNGFKALFEILSTDKIKTHPTIYC